MRRRNAGSAFLVASVAQQFDGIEDFNSSNDSHSHEQKLIFQTHSNWF